jgi:hypothetical protein
VPARSRWQRAGNPGGPSRTIAPLTGTRGWTRHEVTAQIPPDAANILGIFLNGHGQIELRDPELEPHPVSG